MFILSSCHLVTLSSLPLADSDDGAGKIIGAVVFLAIWAVSAIGSWIKKQQEQQKKRRGDVPIPESSPQPVRKPTTRKGRPLQQRQSAPTARRSGPPPISQAPRPSRFDATTDAPRTAVAAPLQTAQRDARPAAPNHEGPAAARRRPSLAAPAIAGWLKPKTLRQQFILTEIFQPPIALRDRPE